jgi:tetratricopeptide (TPR) repeat protein
MRSFIPTGMALLLALSPSFATGTSGTNALSAFVPAEAKQLASQGERAFAHGNLTEAESLYKKALEFAPENPPILVSMAAVETRLGKIQESDVFLRHALRSDLNNGPAWLLLGMNALSQKRDDEAFANLTQAVLHDTGNARAHNYLGMAAERKGWNEVAEQELRRAAELNSGYADANFNLAVLYLKRTPPLVEMARRHYQRAVDLGTPHDPLIEAQIAKAIATPASPASPSATLP